MSKENRKEDALVFQQLGQEWLPLFELLVDQLFNEGILREIPIVRTILSAIKTRETISDHLFNRKLSEVLLSLSELDPEKREEYIQNWRQDVNRDKTAEHLFLIINQLNDMDKPRLLGVLFQAYLAGEIADFKEFKRMTIILDNAIVEDIQVLIDSDDLKSKVSQESIDNLAISGMTVSSVDSVVVNSIFVPGSPSYSLNPIGEKMIKIFI